MDFHSVEGGKEARKWGYARPVTWQDQMGELVALRARAADLRARTQKVLVTWKKTSTTSDRFSADYKTRRQLFDEAAQAPDVFDVYNGARSYTWQRMAEYAFVYSPIGRGFDCHRTWEALVLGCIVVVQDNPTVREFASDGRLPIVLAADAASVTKADLDRWAATLRPANVSALMMSNYFPAACPAGVVGRVTQPTSMRSVESQSGV